jgi:ATP-binding cassette subfamily B protein
MLQFEASVFQSEAWLRRISALRNIPPVMRMIWDAAPILTGLSVGLRVVAALAPVSMLWVSKMIVDHVVARSYKGIWILLLAEFALACTAAILGRIVDHCDSLLAEQFAKNISLRIITHCSRLDLASFEDSVFADKLERARVQSTGRLDMLSALGRLVQQAITLVSLAAGVLFYSPWILLLLIGCTIPAFLGESHFALLGYSLSHTLTPFRRELDYLRQLGASAAAAKEVKIFGLGPYLTNRYREIAEQCIRKIRDLQDKRLLVSVILAVVGSAGYYGAYILVVFQALAGKITVGQLTFLAGAIAGTTTNIQSFFSTFSSVADQSLYLSDLLEFFAVEPKIRSPRRPLPAPRKITTGFEFRKVCFHYPGSNRMIIKDLDFRLEPGERVALIGGNGQGKTTLVKLISRLYDPTSGNIFLEGEDLRRYRIEDLSRQIGVIFQDFMRYEMTAADNIGMGRVEEIADRQRISLSAQKGMADEVVSKLEGGLDQLLGRRFEGGVDLSGGEWQKIALSRAYMRDAQLLILDEPSAALDARAEYEVFARFADLTVGKMALLISHRFSTVRMADRILVLKDGSISEQGTHNQLMAMGGQYAQMFDLQAAGYR